MPADATLEHAIDALRSGERETARTLLLQLTEAEPARAEAWLWLAAASTDPEWKLTYLECARTLDPGDQRIIAGLRALGRTVTHEPVKNTLSEAPSRPQPAPTTHMPMPPAAPLERPSFKTTGVRARNPISWRIVALASMIALLIPLALLFVA